jgi:indolepyruvate ferredoxin oxidoreductase beta subunit
MAQRGGSVISHVRMGSCVWSPLIKEGHVDMLVAFEKLEAARWSPYLKSGGLAIINDYTIPPLSVSLGIARYPNNQEIKGVIKQQTDRIYFVDGTSKAKELGDMRTLNIFMLGCVSSFFSIELRVWQDCISRMLPPKILGINISAFEQGRKETTNVNLG